MNKHYTALELDKVLEMLAERASLADSKEAALALEPQTDITLAREELSRTLDAHSMLAKYASPSFGSAKNIGGALARASAGGLLSAGELLDVGEVLRVIRSVSQWRANQSEEKTSSLDIFFGSLRGDRYLEDRIFSSIISPEEISDSASPALADIRRKKRAQAQRIREKLEGIIHSATYQKCLQEPIVTLRSGRFVVPVKAEFRTKLPGLVHDTSSSGSTVFIEPMAVVEANNEIRVLEGKESEETDRILSELSALAGELEQQIKYSYEALIYLDLVFAKAQLAYSMKAGTPELNDGGVIRLKRARHPLLDGRSVVPVDISLGEEFDTLVITGPNTGGKTVSIKTLGLLTLMAMCGMLIPAADGSKICVFKKIFADIGDEQSIEQSLSTFSAHMVNIVGILNDADDRSLALIDELGAGTDPIEGAALATAVLEELKMRGAKTAATTHYAELKAYALDSDRVENGSCEFDVETLRPTYRLLIGAPGRSNAFAISKRLGMPDAVIERAKGLVSAENTRFEDVVDLLERRRLEAERVKNEAVELRSEAQRELEKAREKLAEAERLRDRELKNARSEALRLVEGSKREANALLCQIESAKKELRSRSKNGDSLSELRSTIRRSLAAVDAASDPVMPDGDDGYAPERPLQIGDCVAIAGMSGEGTLLSLPDKSGVAEVNFGSAKLKVSVTRLRLKEKKASKKGSAVVSRETQSRQTVSSDSRCDLRGMTVEEALGALDLFIDSMVMAGLEQVTVIHGKGTGALRAAVGQHLKRHPQVKSFRLGTYGEGESGVTVVTLKK